MRAPPGLPPAHMPVTLPRVLSTAGAARCGIGADAVRHQLGRGRWRVLARGILLTVPDRPSRADWARAGLLLAGPAAALTGWDAVRLVGLGEREAPWPRAVVLTATGRTRVVGGVEIRRTTRAFTATGVLAPDDPVVPLRVVPVARAVCDTALTTRSRTAVRALVTAAVQRGLCTVAELADECAAAPRRDGAGLRLALADAVAGARSVAEARVITALRRARLPRFEVNVPVLDPSGALLAVVDLLWRELRAVLEVDGRGYHFAEQQWQATLARHNALTAAGLVVVHWSPQRVAAAADFAGEVHAWLRARARELGVSPPAAGVPVGPAAPYRLAPPRLG